MLQSDKTKHDMFFFLYSLHIIDTVHVGQIEEKGSNVVCACAIEKDRMQVRHKSAHHAEGERVTHVGRKGRVVLLVLLQYADCG